MTFEIPTTVDIPDGSYVATLEKVEADKGNFGDFRKWSFIVHDVTTEEGKQDLPITALTSANTGPQSKSFQWLTALLGAPPKAGTKIESPTGSRCVVTITHNDKGFPKVETVGPFVDPQQTLPGVPR